MNKFKTFLLFTLFLAFISSAQEIPFGGENIVVKEKLKKVSLNKPEGAINVKSIDSTTVFTAITNTQPEFPYNLSLRIPLSQRVIKENQPMLLTFKARTLKSSLETQEAKVNWIFKQSESSAPKDIVQKSVSITSEWKTYFLPFVATKNIAPDGYALSMIFGFPPQIFEMKDLELYVYNSEFDFSKLPKTKITYSGIEEGAKWRVDAEKRIEQIRKGDFELEFFLNGKPIKNQEIIVSQKKHYFPFGAAIDVDNLYSDVRHLETIKSLFTRIVLENALKMKKWENVSNRKKTIDAVTLLNNSGISVKGHVLLWPGYKYLPSKYFKSKDNPKKITEFIDDHFKNILTATKGKISHWDVLNEVYTNKDIQNILGSDDILYETFEKVKKLDPNAKRFINEYGIISGGGLNKTKQDWYYNFAQTIDKKTNGLLDGIGMQSHIGNDLTPPEKVIEILNRFSILNKNLSISEFTLDIQDDDIRAKYTQDFMTAAFSVPAVSEFLFWGYFEPNNPKAGLVDKDFKLTAMGNAYYKMVFDKWKTVINKSTDNLGKIKDRGFYGEYSFRLKHEGKIYEGSFAIMPNESNKLKFNLQ